MVNQSNGLCPIVDQSVASLCTFLHFKSILPRVSQLNAMKAADAPMKFPQEW